VDRTVEMQLSGLGHEIREADAQGPGRMRSDMDAVTVKVYDSPAASECFSGG
jgi:hypothetical protein